ncbi:MAG: helix-turn-helix transcriptional regulator [Agriterribacter sp.]
MKLKNFNKVIDNTPDHVHRFVETSMNILDRIHELLNQKFDGKQKLLSEKMGKSEAEVSKWLCGVQNFTLTTISKLESAFGESIISVRSDAADATFEQVKCGSMGQVTRLQIDSSGSLNTKTIKYEDVQVKIKRDNSNGIC